MVESLDQFGLDSSDLNRYRLVEVSLEKGCKCNTTSVFPYKYSICIAFIDKQASMNEQWTIMKVPGPSSKDLLEYVVYYS